MPDVKRSKVLPYSPAQMYALVDAIEAYPEFLPWCHKSEIIRRQDDEVHARLEVAAAGFHKSFTTCNRLQKDKMMEIRLIDGPFKHLEGFWRFDHEDGGCRISLDLEFEFAGRLLDFAFGAIFHQVAASLVEAFATRADQLYGAK